MKKINKNELSQLFIALRSNNVIAFEKLYNLYNKLIYSIAFSIVKNKQDAEDIVQMVFIKIYSIDKSKLPSKSESSWLYSITKNEAINFLKKRNNIISLDCIYEIEDNNNEINKIIDKNTYNKLISSLSDKEKEIVSLKILAHLSFDEIGEILKIPIGTIKWKYYKSINTLKILLSNLGIFIITTILSITTFKNQRKTNSPIETETNLVTNNHFREENISESPSKEDFKKEENSILEDNNFETTENVIEIPITYNNTNYIGLSFMGISIVSFIITIVFLIIFIKHQLKIRKNLSK